MDLSHLHFLVVEDHDFQRAIVISLLRQMGAEQITEAKDGSEALGKMRLLPPVASAETGARMLPAQADILVCDLDMPGMDGVELIRHVANEQLVRSIILLSGLASDLISSVENMARAHGLPVLGMIEKPVSSQKLSNLIARFETIPVDDQRFPAVHVDVEQLHAALRQDQFIAYFQPKVAFDSKQLVGFETLARWRHPEYGILSPAAFIGLAEQSELINDLSWRMLELALLERQVWLKAGIDTQIAVNLSLAYLGQVGIAERITGLVRDAGVAAERVILEVTESLVTTNMAHVLENLARLRMRGFGISIDDYGTGFSSMQQLSRIPFTELKVDQSFVASAAAKPNLRTILDSSLQLARKLGLSSVAEGIEKEEEWALLKSLGCDIAQGYFIARPLAASSVIEWSRNWAAQIPLVVSAAA